MARKALKGLSGIQVFEIIKNTEEEYEVESTSIRIPFAQTLTREDKTSSDAIFADDEIYDDEEILEGEDMELTIPEADLDKYPILEGGTYDPNTKEYHWGGNNSKDYGMTFKAKRKDGTYRMFRYYRVKFKKVKQDLQTQDNGTQISVLNVTLTAYRRALIEAGEAFPKLRTYKDTSIDNQTEDLKWLDTIPTVPDAQPAPQPTPVLENLNVTSAAGTETGKTAITVDPVLESGNSYKIKMAANPTLPEYDAVISGGYSNWDGVSEIEATAGQIIVVVEVDGENKAKKAGQATIVVSD